MELVNRFFFIWLAQFMFVWPFTHFSVQANEEKLNIDNIILNRLVASFEPGEMMLFKPALVPPRSICVVGLETASELYITLDLSFKMIGAIYGRNLLVDRQEVLSKCAPDIDNFIRFIDFPKQTVISKSDFDELAIRMDDTPSSFDRDQVFLSDYSGLGKVQIQSEYKVTASGEEAAQEIYRYAQIVNFAKPQSNEKALKYQKYLLLEELLHFFTNANDIRIVENSTYPEPYSILEELESEPPEISYETGNIIRMDEQWEKFSAQAYCYYDIFLLNLVALASNQAQGNINAISDVVDFGRENYETINSSTLEIMHEPNYEGLIGDC